MLTLGSTPIERQGKVHERFVKISDTGRDVVVRDNDGWTWYNHYELGRDVFPTYAEAVADVVRRAHRKRKSLLKSLSTLQDRLTAATHYLELAGLPVPEEKIKKPRKATK